MDSSSLDTARFQQLLEICQICGFPKSIDLGKIQILSKIKDLQEKQRAMLNQMVAKLTNVCWDKCITGSVGNSISHSEATCLSNCAHRFMELSMLTIQRFKSMQ